MGSDFGYTVKVEEIDHQRRFLAREQTFRVFKNRTVSSVFCMSGIFSSSPAFRLCVLASINWYLLDDGAYLASLDSCGNDQGVRYHFLKAFHRPIHFGSRGNIVLDLVHKRRIGDASRVCLRIFAARRVRVNTRAWREHE